MLLPFYPIWLLFLFVLLWHHFDLLLLKARGRCDTCALNHVTSQPWSCPCMFMSVTVILLWFNILPYYTSSLLCSSNKRRITLGLVQKSLKYVGVVLYCLDLLVVRSLMFASRALWFAFLFRWGFFDWWNSFRAFLWSVKEFIPLLLSCWCCGGQ